LSCPNPLPSRNYGDGDGDGDSNDPNVTPIYFRDIAPALEFACWVVVALAPLLRWVNGAAVTQDQFVIQIVLTSFAAVGALSLRFYNFRARHRAERTPSDQSHLE
jgi:hypothetical protein